VDTAMKKPQTTASGIAAQRFTTGLRNITNLATKGNIHAITNKSITNSKKYPGVPSDGSYNAIIGVIEILSHF